MNYSGAVVCHIRRNLSATVKSQPVAAASCILRLSQWPEVIFVVVRTDVKLHQSSGLIPLLIDRLSLLII